MKHKSHLPAKEEATETAEAVHRGRDLTWTGTMPVATFVVARAACRNTWAVTSRQSKRAPTAVQGKIAEAIWKGLRPSHRRGSRLAIYLWHSPILAIFKHLADRRGRADNARTASTRHRELIPGLARTSLFSRKHRLSGHVGRRYYPPFCVSTCPLPSGPQFPAAKKAADFPVRRYKIPVSSHEKLFRFSTVS